MITLSLRYKILQTPEKFINKMIRTEYRQRLYDCKLLRILNKNCVVKLITHRAKYNNSEVKRKLTGLRIGKNTIRFVDDLRLCFDIYQRINSGENISPNGRNSREYYSYERNKVNILRKLRELNRTEIEYLIDNEIEYIYQFVELSSVLNFDSMNNSKNNLRLLKKLLKIKENSYYEEEEEDFEDLFIKHLRRK